MSEELTRSSSGTFVSWRTPRCYLTTAQLPLILFIRASLISADGLMRLSLVLKVLEETQ